MIAEKELQKPVLPGHTKAYITDDELSVMFDVSKRTTKRWRDSGLIKFFRLPGSRIIRYTQKAVEDFVTRNEHQKTRKLCALVLFVSLSAPAPLASLGRFTERDDLSFTMVRENVSSHFAVSFVRIVIPPGRGRLRMTQQFADELQGHTAFK